ncbi:MAG: hypothetical protein OEU56_13140 [Rhodospirillales bacterium]|nr:hypothetical protein [Rhodospirillales bacterium]MDH3967958.1 hypothetical protein [Rhodospirillales bacterium]
MPYLKQNRHMDNFLEALLRDHQRYLPIVEFLDAIIKDASELTWGECEQIGLELGKQNRSEFCAGIRSGMIEALGADQEEDRAEKLRPILAFARKLNEDSSSITEADIQPVRDAGWSDQTVEDVAGLVAILKVYSILANSLGFKALPEAAFAEIGTATVQMNGYTPVFRTFVKSKRREH